MKRIAILVDNITLKAGTERAVSNLCNGLAKRYPDSYDITIISLFSNKSQKIFFELNNKIKVVHLDHPNNFSKYTKIFWYRELIQKVRKTVLENKIEIVIGTTYVHNILLPLITKKSNIKTIGCEHEVYGYPSKLMQLIRQKVYPKLDQLVVLNKTERTHYKFLSNVCIIPNNLPYIKRGESSLNEKNIIAVGRLTYQKGFDLLIEIMEKVVIKHPDWKLNIFGEGEDHQNLQKTIEMKGLGRNIELCGSVQNISEHYLKSSIFALSSRWESFGLVVIEAMNHGLPVVSFDCDGPKNIIKDQTEGFLISDFDKNAFAEKLESLIENREMRIKIAKEAVRSSQQYEEQNIMPLWNQLIQHIHKI